METLNQKVIDYFYNNNENGTEVIAKHFNLSESQTSRIIDSELIKKKNYIGGESRFYKRKRRDGIKVRVFEDQIEIGFYVSLTALCMDLNLMGSYDMIRRHLLCERRFKIKHSKIKRTFTYSKEN